MLRLAIAALALGVCLSGVLQAEDKPARPRPEKGAGQAEMREKFLKMFDKNGNGKIDPEEQAAIQEARAKRGGPGGPGGANREEFRKKMLEKFDKNGNGKLDEDEIKAAREAFGKRGPGDRPRGKPGERKPEGKPVPKPDAN